MPVWIRQHRIVLQQPGLIQNHMQTRTGNINHKQLHNLRQSLHFDTRIHKARHRRPFPANTIHITREGMHLQLMLCNKSTVNKTVISPTIKQHTSRYVSHKPRQCHKQLLRIPRSSSHTQLRQRWQLHLNSRRVMPNLNTASGTMNQ